MDFRSAFKISEYLYRTFQSSFLGSLVSIVQVVSERKRFETLFPYSLALIIFVVSEKKAFEHFLIGSNVNLCPVVAAIMDF